MGERRTVTPGGQIHSGAEGVHGRVGVGALGEAAWRDELVASADRESNPVPRARLAG